MTEQDRSGSGPRPITRRAFLKLAAMAGLLAGCGSAEKLVSPTSTPQPTTTPEPSATPTAAPTSTPTTVPTAAPTATPTVAPPTAPSTVVLARHSGVWDGEQVVPEAIDLMLDVAIAGLTGLDGEQAWASLFDPGERIAIKVNTIDSSDFWTRVPLVMAVTERLQAIGIPAEQIVIFDRFSRELEGAGFPVNRDGPGVRCLGTDFVYTRGWSVLDTNVSLSDILLDCDALINMPVLKYHGHAGITFAMKNHFGTIDRPAAFHRPRTGPAIAEINALPEIQERTRLIVGDALTVCPTVTSGWFVGVRRNTILMGLDPVAHDTVGLQVLGEVMAAEGFDDAVAARIAEPWLIECARRGLGTSDPNYIQVKEIDVG
jgi:uncharacterized protein (DUF362 family)